MKEVILMDTGPLVALYNARDEHHKWVCEQMQRMPDEVITCEPVLTEACFLLARARTSPTRILQAVRRGILKPSFEIADEAAALETLMSRYADTPMSLADACLVRLSEIHRDCRIFTLDRDFKHYRRFGRSVIPVLSPW
ncbi:MAG: type II toxin-antitoxin system VapC family toxin [Prosthecobacter sp.]|jgi:predicted nucleic acid-binding protein